VALSGLEVDVLCSATERMVASSAASPFLKLSESQPTSADAMPL
jgi:hypothetical protein